MATNSSCSSTQQMQVLDSYAGSLAVVYLYLMTPTVLGSLTLPLLLALFYLSNARQRRGPMFICVALATLLQIAQSIQQATIHMRMLYHPNPEDQGKVVFTDPILISTLVLELIPNWVADIALLFRLLAVYPYSSTPTARWCGIIVPPLVFKLARVACWTGFLYALTAEPGGQLPHFLWTPQERQWTVAERTVTAIDNAWASGFFLWKLRGAVRPSEQLGRVSSDGSRNSFGSRVRALFWLSVTNFVIPVPMCFIQIGFAAAMKNSIVYEIVQHYINWVSVLCVAFATVWYTSAALRAEVKEGADTPLSPGAVGSPGGGRAGAPTPLRFRRTQSTVESGESGLSPETPRSSETVEKAPEQSLHSASRPVRVDWSRQTTI